MAISKSTGSTGTEKLLAELCDRTFLKLWSYPNPFKEDGKEFCDLLVVFEDHVIIFFDRESHQLDKLANDPQLAWTRWKRTAIDAQIQTAHGAERYLRSGRPLYLDSAGIVPFPVKFNRDRMTVHKILVAHGASEACKNWSSDNVSGSLAISYVSGTSKSDFIFLLHLDKSNPVHVFDSYNLPILLGELDTVADFTAYLDAKGKAVAKFDVLTYAGEEDLLAHYPLNLDSNGEHFIGTADPSINAVMIGEGEWVDFAKSPVYRRRKKADENSYLWDEIIQRTCQNALDGTFIASGDVANGRSSILELAKEPRHFRRALADKMTEAIRNFPHTGERIMRNVSSMPSSDPKKRYVFLQLDVADHLRGDFETECRPKRQTLLEIARGSIRNHFPDLTKIVGIAIDAPKSGKAQAEDFLLMDCSNWDDERRKHYDDLNKDFRFFATADLKIAYETVHEFPPAAPGRRFKPTMAKKGNPASNRRLEKNALCSCGSGKPYRWCHMSR